MLIPTMLSTAAPVGSKKSMRTLCVVSDVLETAISVNQPPPLTTCGKSIAPGPPMIADAGPTAPVAPVGGPPVVVPDRDAGPLDGMNVVDGNGNGNVELNTGVAANEPSRKFMG